MVSQRDSWLALTVEEPLEPGLPICDPHHHFWDREGDRYLLDQLTQDLAGGHNVAQTVFIERHSMYRARGPEELRPVGEVEADEGLAGEAGDTGKLESGAAAVARHGAESHLPEAQRRLRRQLPPAHHGAVDLRGAGAIGSSLPQSNGISPRFMRR